jgi:pimeloyl-ACP methyl ester carboxylesterase
LHDAGFVVLVVGLRGTGSTIGGASQPGQTFGLREAGDVKAAVDLLRHRQFVDPQRIALVGVGTGANASLICLASDPQLSAAVLEDPTRGLDEMLTRHIVPKRDWLRWIRPLCKWTFEIAYEVDGAELSLDRYAKTMGERPVLMLQGNASCEDFSSVTKVAHIREFLTQKTAPDDSTTSKTSVRVAPARS